MRDEDLVTNGKDGTIGEFDLRPAGRVQKLINIDLPIFTGQHKTLKPGLAVADIATNDFIDPAIGLPASR